MVEFAGDTVDDGWRVPDEMWELVRAVLPLERPHPSATEGRPWVPARRCMDGIFYVLRTGC